ncbi:MAG: exopolyphosphatase [Niastella sp. SCN 39-18]|nr:exopolyphosphatase [Sphingobacteriales bacterium]ODT52823.1 MAG: exopolyphosphatase [Niastella sp. SCN 39-18]OJW10956.1 MAG: exopolyphosphatase [Sphingobacteriales bacterium 39-19]
MILAAIDIGSNAARLLIKEVTETPGGKLSFNKLNLVRVPLRLGFDVFENKAISEDKFNMFLNSMISFKYLTRAYAVQKIKACATSAMRDAINGRSVIEKIYEHTGIQIEIISGDMEANFVFENHVAENMNADHSYMYIDVGGGSTEISFFSNGLLIFNKSFNIGTIRLLKGQLTESDWDVLKNTIKAVTKGHKEVIAIGSGGNINKVFSLSKKKDGKSLSLDLLKDYYKELAANSIEARMEKYNLRRDRADVIVPALQIYIQVMRCANANEIFVPRIGLADGLIQHLWAEIKNKS